MNAPHMTYAELQGHRFDGTCWVKAARLDEMLGARRPGSYAHAKTHAALALWRTSPQLRSALKVMEHFVDFELSEALPESSNFVEIEHGPWHETTIADAIERIEEMIDPATHDGRALTWFADRVYGAQIVLRLEHPHLWGVATLDDTYIAICFDAV